MPVQQDYSYKKRFSHPSSVEISSKKSVEPATGAKSGTGNATITYDPAVITLQVVNESGAELTFSANGASYPVPDKGSFEHGDPDGITSVSITASGGGKWYTAAYR